jgi:hydrogenase small subunit
LQYITQGAVPDLDRLGRPLAFFGNTIHDRCYRRPFYDAGKFAKSFDDEGARNGWCLFELGCKGPTANNACATMKWNGGISFPIESGHGCIGCSEPNFWDAGSLYAPLSSPLWGKAGEVNPRLELERTAAAVALGTVVGVGSAAMGRHRQNELGGRPPKEK